MSARLQSAFDDLGIPAVLRTIEQIEDLLDGYDVMHPGVVPVQDWPVLVGRGGPVVYVGGIGRVPSPARPDGRLQ